MFKNKIFNVISDIEHFVSVAVVAELGPRHADYQRLY